MQEQDASMSNVMMDAVYFRNHWLSVIIQKGEILCLHMTHAKEEKVSNSFHLVF